MSLPWTRGFTGGLHHVVSEEIGLEEGAEMDVGRSCVGAKGQQVRWAPPVGAVSEMRANEAWIVPSSSNGRRRLLSSRH
jgi:hypothetical protein